jgi:hypothetical protein
MTAPKIDPEFQALIPPLSAAEYAALRADIEANGCRDPIAVWRGLIIDGYNRYHICTELGCAYQQRALDFSDREAVKVWMLTNQLARRNLSPDQQIMLFAMRGATPPEYLPPAACAQAKEMVAAAAPQCAHVIAGKWSVRLAYGNWLRATGRAPVRAPKQRHPKTDPAPPPESPTADQRSPIDADLLAALAQASKKPIHKDKLAERLHVSADQLEHLLRYANVHVENEHVQLSAHEQIRTVQDSRILPTTSERQTIGVISDLHLGSKYCLRVQLIDCVEYMYKCGIRYILSPGDWLDGCYQHGVFELSHTGIRDQTRDAFETLPQRDGLRYGFITGNHDETFAALTGVNVGEYIVSTFKSWGRDDVQCFGACGAFVKVKGAVVHLWHPLGGMSYAKSYKLQKQIEKYGAGEKPHILLGGHVHQFCVVEDRGVFACFCPTFQASGSAFSKRLGGQPALGGLILSWEIAGVDLVRNFAVERRRYFEVELPQEAK